MEKENEVIKPADDEEAGDFARVAAMVEAGEPEPGAVATENAAHEPEPVDATESMAGFLTLAGAMCGQVGFKRTAAVWNPETCQQAAALSVPVMRKYPWGQRVLAFFETGAGAEEIALGVFVAPLALATYAAVKADMQPDEEPKEATPNAPKQPTANAGEMREVHGHAN